MIVEEYWDNPEWDGTDGAHPAWWRGCDHGCKQTALAMLKIIDEKEKTGFFGGELLEKLALEIQKLLIINQNYKSLCQRIVMVAEDGSEEKECALKALENDI